MPRLRQRQSTGHHASPWDEFDHRNPLSYAFIGGIGALLAGGLTERSMRPDASRKILRRTAGPLSGG
jgi:hypothetical protein